MRISDWSSDVCSSDLHRPPHTVGRAISRTQCACAALPRLSQTSRRDIDDRWLGRLDGNEQAHFHTSLSGADWDELCGMASAGLYLGRAAEISRGGVGNLDRL